MSDPGRPFVFFEKKRRMTRTLLLGMALALAAGACDGDDDDDAASPTPYAPDICYILWATPVGDVYDAYVWQGAASLVAGTAGASGYTFNQDEFDSILGFFYFRTDDTFDEYETLGVTTAGGFSLQASGVQRGDTFTFNDDSNQLYFEYPASGPLLGQVASNGTGSFTGALSDPEGQATPGQGSLTIAYAGSNLELDALYAECVDETMAVRSGSGPSPAVLESARRALRQNRTR